MWLCNVQRSGSHSGCQTQKEKLLSWFSKDPSFLTALIWPGCGFLVNAKFWFQFSLNYWFLQTYFLPCEFSLPLCSPCPPLSSSLIHMILSVMGVISLSISPSVPTINTHSPAPALHVVCVYSLYPWPVLISRFSCLSFALCAISLVSIAIRDLRVLFDIAANLGC